MDIGGLSLRKQFLCLGGLVLLLEMLLFFSFAVQEPSYGGKYLSEWIRGLEEDNVNPSEERQAALRAMGPPAVNKLIALLEVKDSLLKQKAFAFVRRDIKFYNAIVAPGYLEHDQIYHERAAIALGEIGPGAANAIPALMRARTNGEWSMDARASAALIKIRHDFIAPLLGKLADTESTNWMSGVLTLKYLGADGEAAAPTLIKELDTTNTVTRLYAIEALGGIGSDPERTVPALLRCLMDSDSRVRASVVYELHFFPRMNEVVVPALLSCMKDTNANVWGNAAAEMSRRATPLEIKALYVRALVESLTNSDVAIRENARIFLKRVDAGAGVR